MYKYRIAQLDRTNTYWQSPEFFTAKTLTDLRRDITEGWLPGHQRWAEDERGLKIFGLNKAGAVDVSNLSRRIFTVSNVSGSFPTFAKAAQAWHDAGEPTPHKGNVAISEHEVSGTNQTKLINTTPVQRSVKKR